MSGLADEHSDSNQSVRRFHKNKLTSNHLVDSPKTSGSLDLKTSPSLSAGNAKRQELETVSVTLGSVTLEVQRPKDFERQANILAGQVALGRLREALATPGVKLVRRKGIPLYFGCPDRPGWMIRELNGKKTMGRFVGDRFVPEKRR